ncbi:MAG: hypothetical protein B7Y76_07755 [Sphingobacteriia bacterium 35-40-5]|nr:MAG: hypothetical protein B7Y76_07755 [Sphingobacteriia bacterium 35-40-5]
MLGYKNHNKNSFIWFFSGYSNDGFFAASATRVTIGSPSVGWQTEGLDYISTGRLMMSCETSTSNVASLYTIQQ